MPRMAPAASRGPDIVSNRRHPEWRHHNVRWRFLLDSYEGGDTYRNAVYGTDSRGLPLRNLIRHKREYPEPREQGNTYAFQYTGAPEGYDPSYAATDDDYELRLARTPVPTIVAEAVQSHLSPVFADEPDRETTSKAIEEWWEDVDGLGTSVKDWMSDTVAPLLLVFGCLDLCFDHPRLPDGETVETRADQLRLKLDAVVASVVLPENLVWWKLAPDGRSYAECLVCELQDDGRKLYRLWEAEEWTLYDDKGTESDRQAHPYGRPPIVRVFDRRRFRFKHVGLPRYEVLAEIQREYYNRDSELILSDTTQAHPLLQGPEDFVQSDGSIPIGPSWLLPKKKSTNGGTASYEGFDVVDFPKGGADSIRQNLAGLRDRADRAAFLTKPAGAAGTQGNTVSQSGVSKRLDQDRGNDLLSAIAAVLERVEMTAVEYALLVAGNGTVDRAALDATSVQYARTFDLLSPDETAAGLLSFQDALDRAGACPETESALLRRLVRQLLPGLDDDDYAEMDQEIKTFLKDRAAEKAEARAAGLAAAQNLVTETPTDGTATANGQPPGTAATAASATEPERLAGTASATAPALP